MLFFDVDYIDTEGWTGTHYALIADDENHAKEICILHLIAGSNCKPQDVKILSVRKSIYKEESKD